MTKTKTGYIARCRYVGRYGRVMTVTKRFSTEAGARRYCQRMKRAGCLDATFKEV